jgi:serine/threonine protein kinase/tetratricopeptide (TPR) repeat protein
MALNRDNEGKPPRADGGGDGVEESRVQSVDAGVIGANVGRQVGPYKLLEKIGEGGFGVVFVAEQREPVKRRVALKIIKAGMDTREVVARFEAERQALAMMNHPNIANVLDGGTTEAGLPYFAMELVRGVKITEYCDQHRLATPERLELCIRVCQAVQHAHQKGIIHRDLKPSNILVTLHDGVPVPKVIDFGIAKAMHQDLTDKTLYTQLHQFVGTPSYMSPEQACMSGLDVDTRSDIYSLGVLLYEILTGCTPFHEAELVQRGVDEIVRRIREEEPLRPSTQVSRLTQEQRTTTAKRRGMDAMTLVRQLRGDLDCVVMKCLEKDRTRRYETATALASDLRRYLENDLVTARPPSAGYRMRKWIRRNNLTAVAAALVFVALVGGIGVSTTALVRESKARKQEAQAEEAKHAQSVRADAVANFLENVLSTVSTVNGPENQTAARELLGTTERIASAALSNAPVTELRLEYKIARSYVKDLVELDEQTRQWARIDELMRRVPPDQLPDPIEKMRILAVDSKLESGLPALPALHALEAEYRHRTPPDLLWAARCLYHEGSWLFWSGKYEEAEPKFAEAFRILPRGILLGEDFNAAEYYSYALSVNGQPSNALAVAQSGLLPWRDVSSDLWDKRVSVCGATTIAYCTMGRFDEALSFLKEQEREIQSLGSARDFSASLGFLQGMHAGILARGRRLREALDALEKRETQGLVTRSNCTDGGAIALGANDFSAYQRWCARAMARFASGQDGPGAWEIAWLLLARPQSPSILRAAEDLVKRVELATDYSVARAPALRGYVEYRMGHYAKALASFHRQPTDASSTYFLAFAAKVDPIVMDCGFQTAMACAQLGRVEEAQSAFKRSLKALDRPTTGTRKLDLGWYPDYWFLQNAARQEAEQLFREKGIPVPSL